MFRRTAAAIAVLLAAFFVGFVRNAEPLRNTNSFLQRDFRIVVELKDGMLFEDGIHERISLLVRPRGDFADCADVDGEQWLITAAKRGVVPGDVRLIVGEPGDSAAFARPAAVRAPPKPPAARSVELRP